VLISKLSIFRKASIIHGISRTRLRVAMKSSQKKKLYLKSFTTQDWTSNSIVNKMSDKNSPAKKYGSAFFEVSHTLRSSPKRAKMVVEVMMKVTKCPSTIPRARYLMGGASSSPACIRLRRFISYSCSALFDIFKFLFKLINKSNYNYDYDSKLLNFMNL